MFVPNEELHQMIDALPEDKKPALKEFLESLLAASLEDKDWLDADLGELPPYEWGEEGIPDGKSVCYKRGAGSIVEGDR